MDCRSNVRRLMQGVHWNSKFPKDQAQKRQALFISVDEVQEVNLFQVRNIRRESGSLEPYIRDHRK